MIKTIIFTNPKRVYHEKVKLYERSQIEDGLFLNSFKVINVWDGYDGGPWRHDGNRQLFYCLAE